MGSSLFLELSPKSEDAKIIAFNRVEWLSWENSHLSLPLWLR